MRYPATMCDFDRPLNVTQNTSGAIEAMEICSKPSMTMRS